MTSQSAVSEQSDLQESLRCLMSPVLALPESVAYIVRFYDPISKQYQLLSQVLDPHLKQTSACLKRLAKTIEEVLPSTSSEPFKISQDNNNNRAQWLYPFSLPDLAIEHHLFVITNTVLIPSQTHYLQTIAQAIANHLKSLAATTFLPG
ncbi:MAG: hypothetical protein F6K00_12865 [Leptolyngbya sp. SIOISBB]|nr:hypothetical protein [Leptolyngbya sp. SIOISBB]